MKCWFLDETQEPEEKPLTAERRREPYNKLIPHNRELMQLITTEQNKQEFCTCSTVFGTFLLPSWDEYDVEFHFYQRSQHKSATFFSFFWTDLKTDNPFCGIGKSEWWWSETGISICGKTDSLFSIHFIHNYNKILKSDWLSTVLISAE